MITKAVSVAVCAILTVLSFGATLFFVHEGNDIGAFIVALMAICFAGMLGFIYLSEED